MMMKNNILNKNQSVYLFLSFFLTDKYCYYLKWYLKNISFKNDKYESILIYELISTDEVKKISLCEYISIQTKISKNKYMIL